MNRALNIGDRVVIRPIQAHVLSKEAGYPLVLHAEYTITDVEFRGRRRLFWLGDDVPVWPSQVRLAKGAAERADLRFEKMEREIEKMKAKRRRQRHRGRKATA